MDEDITIIRQQLTKLPEELVSVVQSDTTKQSIDALAREHQLDETEYEAFSNEVYFVLLGLESPTDFEGNIQNALGISGEESAPLASNTSELIFRPVITALNAFNEQQLEEAGEAETEAQPAAAQQAPAPQSQESYADIPRYTDSTAGEAPEHLPGAQEVQQEQSERKQQPYADDPYRESFDQNYRSKDN